MSARDALSFVWALAAVAGYFIILIWLLAPQYLGMFTRLLA